MQPFHIMNRYAYSPIVDRAGLLLAQKESGWRSNLSLNIETLRVRAAGEGPSLDRSRSGLQTHGTFAWRELRPIGVGVWPLPRTVR